jgi:hypothetical protein
VCVEYTHITAFCSPHPLPHLLPRLPHLPRPVSVAGVARCDTVPKPQRTCASNLGCPASSARSPASPDACSVSLALQTSSAALTGRLVRLALTPNASSPPPPEHTLRVHFLALVLACTVYLGSVSTCFSFPARLQGLRLSATSSITSSHRRIY